VTGGIVLGPFQRHADVPRDTKADRSSLLLPFPRNEAGHATPSLDHAGDADRDLAKCPAETQPSATAPTGLAPEVEVAQRIRALALSSSSAASASLGPHRVATVSAASITSPSGDLIGLPAVRASSLRIILEQSCIADRIACAAVCGHASDVRIVTCHALLQGSIDMMRWIGRWERSQSNIP